MELKVFISQPMHGLSDDQIAHARRMVVGYLARALDEVAGREYTIKVINTIRRDDAPENASRMWYLGQSIQDMDEADILVLAKGWREATGCRCEAHTWWMYKGIGSTIVMDMKDPDESHKAWEEDLVRQVRYVLKYPKGSAK